MSKVVVGLSGGVDSAVTALLLIEKGYEVIGVTMTSFEQNQSELNDAVNIAKTLGIRHEIIDMSRVFKEAVVDYFVREYISARTPNPCIMCNPYVKFESLMRMMISEGADYIATGHYAKIIKLENNRYTIAVNKTQKDQTYALCRLPQNQLEHLLTPLSDYTKDEVRQMATDAGLSVATKKDSQDICFVQNGKYFEFIKQYLSQNQGIANDLKSLCNVCDFEKEGNFVDEEGNILGRHNGISHYTIGQRKKLGLSLNKPVFVKELRLLSNEVVISTAGDVYQNELICSNVALLAVDYIENDTRLLGKIRYAHEGTFCTVERLCEENRTDEQNVRYKVIFEKPVRAVTPGQAIVFYKDDFVYASGIIC